VEAHPDDRAAIALVATIDELFVIDAQAQKQLILIISNPLPSISFKWRAALKAAVIESSPRSTH
jgi:hypothetical protein